MIDYRLLTFMDLHKTMNYTKTARNLHITQPAVTQHIHYLERKYHVQLFHYEKKHLECTKAGEYLYQHALALVSGADKLLQELAHLHDERETIRMGATMSVSESIVAPFLSALYERNPQLDFQFTVGDSQKLIRAVCEGSVDFAWIEGRFDRTQFRSHRLKKETMVLVLPNDHPLLSRKTISIADLLKEHLLVLNQDDDVLASVLAQHNLSLQNFATCTCIPQLSLIKQLVAHGAGIAFLYEGSVREELAAHKLATRKVKGLALMREFHMIAQKDSLYHRQYDAYFKLFKQTLTQSETTQ